MRACDHADRPAGVGLVTNTELSSPYDGLNALESTVFGRFESFFDVRKMDRILAICLNLSSCLSV